MNQEAQNEPIESRLTRRFLRQMARWLHAGMPEHPIFSKDHALCASYGNWLNVLDVNDFTYAACFEHLTCLFVGEGRDSTYPFNGGRMINFREELDNDALYQNKERLSFIRRNYRKPKP